jgi:CHASE3 domain sensor protein
MVRAPEDYIDHPWRLGLRLNEKLEGSDNVEGVKEEQKACKALLDLVLWNWRNWALEVTHRKFLLSNLRPCLAPFFDARALMARDVRKVHDLFENQTTMDNINDINGTCI